MDLNTLSYFCRVAREPNINQVARKIGMTPSALSKAIIRLETELETSLFHRRNKRLIITEAGKQLAQRAQSLFDLEERIRKEVQGGLGTLRVVLAGPEVCLLEAANSVRQKLEKPGRSLEMVLKPSPEVAAIEMLERGEVDLVVTCGEFPTSLRSRVLRKVKFVTCAGPTHALGKSARRIISINEVLKYPFAQGDAPFFGAIPLNSNVLDGWRDDRFPRHIGFKSSSLKIVEHLLVTGAALSYLPDYYAEKLSVTVLKISGCPYQCEQNLSVVGTRDQTTPWLTEFWRR